MKSKTNLRLMQVIKAGYKVFSNRVYAPDGSEQKLYITNNGYPAFTYGLKNINRGLVHVHRMVAFQKYGDLIFKKGCQVRHLDSNKLNFSANNIDIGTGVENWWDRPKSMRDLMVSLSIAKVKKLTQAQADSIRAEYSKTNNLRVLSKKYNCSQSTLSAIIRGKIYVSQ